MSAPLAASGTSQPEKLLDGLRHRLRAHALWEAVLLFLPPLLAVGYIAFLLHRLTWVGANTVVAAGAALVCVAVLLAAWRFRSRLASPRVLARLIDNRAEAKDRFVTLATIDPTSCSHALLSRLRSEAASLVPRVDLKRDFPFRVPRSVLNASIASLAAVLLFHLLLDLAPRAMPRARAVKELALLSQELSRVSGFEKPAERLKTLLAKLEEPTVSKEEKHALTEQLLIRIREQLAGAQRGTGSGEELLRRAADLLSGLEQGLEKGQGKGSGGGQQRTPWGRDGAGNKTGEGSDAEHRGGLTIPSLNLPGSPVPGLTTPRGGQLKGEAEGGRGGEGQDAQGPDKGSNLERGTKAGAELKGIQGKWEQKPTGPTPERFLRPGEKGEAGLKGSRFVTVRLPEEETGSEAGGAQAGGKRNRVVSPKPPVGNLPLRQPDQPEASPEKQPVPLEYRGMIR